ncbi:MAG: hypothetical protein ACR2MQ_04290 [Gemmatimonadaceae bacterium]
MRSHLLVVSVALVAGCAASSQSEVGTRNDRISANAGSAGTLTYFTDPSLAVNTIDIPVEQAWPRLLTVYQSMGIPITKLDSTAHVVGAERAILGHRLGKHPVSYAVDCGTTTLTAQSIADSYRVTLTSLTQLQSNGSQTVVRTSVSGAAKDQSGVSSDPLQCSSTGALERDIAAALGTPK